MHFAWPERGCAMIVGEPLVPGAQALVEAKAYLRVEGTQEDALIERLVGSAAELCEGFICQALLTRGFTETIALSSSWIRLGATPVQAISSVEGLRSDGDVFALPADAYAIDIDAHGDGWVRVIEAPGATRIRVSYQVGMTADWATLPQALRQGMVRLAAHLFTHRDEAGDAGPPAAVTALWRPWRRMRLK